MLNKKLISIIVPTRDRHKDIIALIQSISDTVSDPNKIELILMSDYDDSLNFLMSSYLDKVKFDNYMIIRQRKLQEFSLPKQYYNPSLNLSSKSYFKWILGNDCSIQTQHWDKQLVDILLNDNEAVMKDIDNNLRYYYISIADDTHWTKTGHIQDRPQSCCFPIVSSNWVNDVGEFYANEIPAWGADCVLYETAKKLPQFVFIDLHSTLEIKHACVHNKQSQADPVHEHIKNVSKQYGNIAHKDISNSKVEYIKNLNNIRNSIIFKK